MSDNKNNIDEISNPQVENSDNVYEFNTRLGCSWLIDSFSNFDTLPVNVEEINEYIKNPMLHIVELRKLAWWSYISNGAVSSGIDYMRTMHTLDGIVYSKKQDNKKIKNSKRYFNNKIKMQDVLEKIQYKTFIRDALLKDCNDGMVFYYFETAKLPIDNSKYLSNFDVESITEISSTDYNVSIISLPVDYCRIVGKKNNRYEIAFNLQYFLQFSPNELKRKIQQMPKEIRDGWAKRGEVDKQGCAIISDKSWIRLNVNNTIVHKIKSSQNQPFGIPLAIAALDDILYADYFTKTKRQVLDKMNNTIFYETFPLNKDGKSSLTEKQQQQQHTMVRDALLTKKNQSGTVFFSLAGGTTLDNINIDTSIFDEKNENAIKDTVPQALGFAPSALYGSSSTGSNYATAVLNLEMIAGQVYSWINDIVSELNKCINANLIKDNTYPMSLYILPTTYINRDKTFNFLKTLYADCGGSLQALIASTGINPDAYLSLMDFEREQSFDELYQPHSSMYQQSGNSGNNKKDKVNDVGRPNNDSSNNENTIISKTNNSNDNPKPNI